MDDSHPLSDLIVGHLSSFFAYPVRPNYCTLTPISKPRTRKDLSKWYYRFDVAPRLTDPSGVTRTITVVHNNINGTSSIGSLARWAVREALERNWRVIAVCRDLDPGLINDVDHRPLRVPPRLHLWQYSVARPTVRAALRGVRADVTMVHQPQLAAIADVWQVHYLSRTARNARLRPPPGWRSRVVDTQAAGVARLEDHYLHRLPARTRVLFCSSGLRADFTAQYGAHPNSAVLHNPALLAMRPATDRPNRRAELTDDHPGPVVGFLGGNDARKGAQLVTEAVARAPEVFLLHAGLPPLADHDPRLRGRTRGLGRLADVTELLDCVDALLIPSRFDPFPLVVAEAAARGIPVIVTDQVGSAPLVRRTGAGLPWPGLDGLGAALRTLTADRAGFAQGSQRLLAELDPHRQAEQLFAEFEQILDRKSTRSKATRATRAAE